jgi:hypothetical protein
MLFTVDAWPGLADGTITLTFRTWTKPQARTGGTYRVGGMLLEAIDVSQVAAATIDDEQARRAGAPDAATLRAALGRGDDDPVWRVELRYVGPDDRIARREDDQLDDDTISDLRARLDRLDRRGSAPWTASTLRLIARYPGIVSTALARHADRERAEFKADVRKLKELGLTESLEVGYRVSPRGEALLRSMGG